MTKIFRNVQKNPTEAKYRKIKKTAIDKRLGGVVGAMTLMHHVGFQVQGEHYVLPEYVVLAHLCEALQTFDKKAQQRAEAEAQLKKIMEQNTQKANAQAAKKEEHRKKMRAQQEEAQKDVRKKIIVDSKANKINFGMKLKKFVPPPPAKKGG